MVYRIICAILLLSQNSVANVVGSDIQNFNPTTNGLDFVTVQSSETLTPGVFNFGFFLNYAVNTMPNYVDVNTSSRTDFEDSLTSGDLNFGVGLTRNWDFGASFPRVFAQTSDDNNNVYAGEVTQTGLTEIRINTKYRFLGDEKGGFATVLTMNLNRVENNPFTGSDPGPTWNLEGVYDWTKGPWAYAINGGFRSRDPGTQIVNVPIQPYEDSVIVSAAASRYLDKYDLKMIGEIFGGFPIDSTSATTDRELSSLELLLGVKKDLRHDLALHAGAGTELYQGSSSADWRVYTGVNWNVGPVWGKQTEAEDKDARQLDKAVSYYGSTPSTTSEKFLVGDVLFAYDSANLSEDFKEVLNDLAKYVLSGKFKSLQVEGHTDSVGAEAYNQGLSGRRAQSVVDYLTTTAGLPADKVSAVGYGESRPVAENSNYQGRAKNRRVEFNITR